MSIKGTIQPDHIPVHKFELIVAGLPPLTGMTLGGLEEETAVIELPDKTVATGGRSGPVEIPFSIPSHHVLEVAAMEVWLQEGKDPVLPSYKKAATLTLTSLTGNTVLGFTFPDMFPSKRTLPDRELANDGDMSTNEYTLNASQMLPLPIA